MKDWVQRAKEEIDRAISNKSISKESLVEGLEEIEEHAGEWAKQLQRELDKADS